MIRKFSKFLKPKKLKTFGKKTFSIFMMLTLVFATSFIFPNTATAAAAVTSFSVLLTRDKAATLSNQTVMFTTPTGVASGQTIILTYDNSTAIPSAFDFEDADVSYDATPDGVCETGDTHVVLAAAPTGATAGIVDTSTTVITFTNGTTAIAAGAELCFEFGTNAEDVITGVEQITNGSAGTTTLVLSGTFTDSGTAAMSIIANDQVVITATVAPTITFTVSDNTIEFGTLSTSAATWADNAGGSTTDVAAHTLTAATNATGGYIVSYNGATLTSGSDTITVAAQTDDANGDPGEEQFGLGISTDGDATITSGYSNAGTPDWTWVASTTTTIITETGPTATETFSMRYLANIAATTEAGAYTTTVTYIATGTF
ncbi:hypothetical protein A3J61_01665 [Candidatus Nomurabacteria bacterium RIFCSPHIGHO2_02_FULL_38_15]|uniref:Cohesin domain-containing protein n=1 Tax=Candidatus Nomurabacteria bacterium RIFCSPHIGHO2_02_FULL_38_15 TaxID=1801752 RepID=A0A1F6VPR7_9BACT|nr:MAG: hypothetical protein A3J61_01665 [Candidatus Nomurabacteria bacterium RIFCSPHIGHO2_02_FULL_38_15]